MVFRWSTVEPGIRRRRAASRSSERLLPGHCEEAGRGCVFAVLDIAPRIVAVENLPSTVSISARSPRRSVGSRRNLVHWILDCERIPRSPHLQFLDELGDRSRWSLRNPAASQVAEAEFAARKLHLRATGFGYCAVCGPGSSSLLLFVVGKYLSPIERQPTSYAPSNRTRNVELPGNKDYRAYLSWHCKPRGIHRPTPGGELVSWVQCEAKRKFLGTLYKFIQPYITSSPIVLPDVMKDFSLIMNMRR
ncbi:uncharacterized protein LOC109720113 [Ananas comosus]|uniref:Uncharacterized protein LOC109720113 n=1 Tax=Ananas comosus TaxID=4615 RepID=A0A6P5G431_ANACO|nr:uncharacterized protein LOC109720113 [Ananas comosus]